MNKVDYKEISVDYLSGSSIKELSLKYNIKAIKKGRCVQK